MNCSSCPAQLFCNLKKKEKKKQHQQQQQKQKQNRTCANGIRVYHDIKTSLGTPDGIDSEGNSTLLAIPVFFLVM